MLISTLNASGLLEIVWVPHSLGLRFPSFASSCSCLGPMDDSRQVHNHPAGVATEPFEVSEWENHLHQALYRKLQKGEDEASLFPPKMLYGPGWIGTRPPTPRLRQSSIGRSRESSLERSPRNARDRGRERNRSKSRSMSPPGPDIRVASPYCPVQSLCQESLMLSQDLNRLFL